MKTKTFFSALYLTSLLCLSGSLQAGNMNVEMKATKNSAHGYKEIHTEELKKLLDSEKNILILDARTKEYDDNNRIPGARFFPYNTSESVILSSIPNKDTLVVVYCTNTQCPASKALADRLVQMGYTNIYKYPEGIQAWMDRGYPVDRVQR